MTATVANEFKKLLARIPKETLKNVWFFPIRRDKKNPEVPGGTILKGNLYYRLSPLLAIKRLKASGNVGIYGLPGGLMFLDLDMEKGQLKASNEFLSKIKPTFTVKTRNGGLQYYYLNDGHYSNQILKENGKEIVEIRADWQYVVSCGSYVTPDDNGNGDGTYRVLYDVPIVPFSGLDEYIQSNGQAKDTEIKTFTKATEEKDKVDFKAYKKKLRRAGKKEKLLTPKEINELRERIQERIKCRLKITSP